MAHVSYSAAAAAAAVVGDAFIPEEIPPFQSQEHPVLDFAAGNSFAIAVEENEEEQEGKQEYQPPSTAVEEGGSSLELKKKRFLEEVESILLPKEDSFSVGASSLGLGIEVIDETALVEALPSSLGIPKKPNKQSRRRAAKKKDDRSVTVCVPKNRKYSRKEMEALRFVNVTQQRKFWKSIYAELQSPVAKEYDSLATTHHHNHNPPQCLPNNKPAPPILSAVYYENRDSELQVMESSENVSLVDPSCSHSLMGEDGCSILEERSENDDSEDDYASIQRPAFLVEGEPNFDSGPPEDGWEYLRRVRWEAHQIPKVKVAKLDRSKLNKDQSAYMPKIPDIAKCPEDLLPLKQWEDVFLAEFSALRANLTCLEGSNAMHSSDLLPVHSSKLLGNNFGESANIMNRDVLLHHHLSVSKAIDQPTNLTAEDKDTALPPENPVSKTSIDQTSSTSPTLPLLSAVLGMDSVKRVSMLLKRIRLLEPVNTITRNDCMWLFALCAAVDTPLDADTSAALRGLLRKCASIRASKAELDEEVVMLNILATISGRYFRQSEN